MANTSQKLTRFTYRLRQDSNGGHYAWFEIRIRSQSQRVKDGSLTALAVVLFDEVRVFHRPHPSPDTDKGAVASIRKWLEENGETP
ncbi:type II toxin-antitoxin system HicA family toxin [Vreelandella titanicae]|jgi:hypothetical protein|uniref:type II toxin-antitoxin system HicA family toxin n=1 Tax=Halomonadaceae TaxID=28256 RepID=UPI000AEF081F|nr:type II toxin-antitoxin system HicA family toxin [Halomonas sp. KHS3]|tara:strand:- start:2241 stop:2498 length:258 start_codon:yes stop_codon:yes gene_type:complete